MHITLIGTGNVGGALAQRWAAAGHRIYLGVRAEAAFKGQALLAHPHVTAHPLAEAAGSAQVVLFATPPQYVVDLAHQLGPLDGKVLIDATNSFRSRPEGYPHAFAALRDHFPGAAVVKCFNSTGYENMLDPAYGGEGIDMFMAGDSVEAKAVARQLALDAGFGACHDFGGDERVALLEQFALAWINLAIFQGNGRDVAFKLIRR